MNSELCMFRRPIPTTPGSCGVDCRLAATVKIVNGAEWSNSLLDPNTFEWQDLADKVKREVSNRNLSSSNPLDS